MIWLVLDMDYDAAKHPFVDRFTAWMLPEAALAYAITRGYEHVPGENDPPTKAGAVVWSRSRWHKVVIMATELNQGFVRHCSRCHHEEKDHQVKRGCGAIDAAHGVCPCEEFRV